LFARGGLNGLNALTRAPSSILSREASQTIKMALGQGLENHFQHRFTNRSYATTSRRKYSNKQRKKGVPQTQRQTAAGQEFPLTVHDMDNKTLVSLAANENHEARKEVLKRHIMIVDKIDYSEAEETFLKIANKNDERLFFLQFPYYVGIFLSAGAAAASFPLVFGYDTVVWFNYYCVTADVPPKEDLETMLEVGSWSWNWMEPPLGQLSFVILCMQFARSQLENLGIRPYTRWVKRYRAENLAKAFPQYQENVIMDYSKTDSFVAGQL